MGKLCWKVAYAPWLIDKEDIRELLTENWSYQELAHGFAIISLFMQLAVFCHAAGIQN